MAGCKANGEPGGDIFLFTRKVRVISHKSELCSHFKAYFEEQ